MKNVGGCLDTLLLIINKLDTDSFLLLSIFSGIEFNPLSFDVIVAFIAAFFFLFFSGFISAAEAAFFSLTPLDKSVREEEQKSSDHIIDRLLENSDRLLATFLILNIFSNITVVILCAFGMNKTLYYQENHLSVFWIQVIILSLSILLFGEIMPKRHAQNQALKFARKLAPFVKILEYICRPFSIILVKITNKFSKFSKKKPHDVSIEEISKALKLSSEEMSEEKEMLEGIISMYNKTAVEIMTSRLDIACVDIKSNFKQIIDYVVSIGYSRIPVYSQNQDNIKGILYIKDLLPYLDKQENFRWQSLMRSVFFVPETKKIDDLLEEFRTNKIHMAVVVDEFGGTSGIVTLEDILEEIVGEISDEYDDETPKYTEFDDAFVLEARIPLSDFFKITGIDPLEFEKQAEEVDTLAGLMLELKGDFPELGEIISFNLYKFEIQEINERRIQKVKLYKTKKEE